MTIPLIDVDVPKILEGINIQHPVDLVTTRNSKFEVPLIERFNFFNIMEKNSLEQLRKHLEERKVVL